MGIKEQNTSVRTTSRSMITFLFWMGLCFSGASMAQTGGTRGDDCSTDARLCPTTSSSSSSSSRPSSSSSGSNTAAAGALLQGAIGIMSQWVEDEERRDEERRREDERLRLEAEAHRQRSQMLQQQQAMAAAARAGQLAAENRAPDGSSKDNPWGEGSTGGGSGAGSSGDGDKDGEGGGAAEKFVALSPDQDHSGKSCSYFTCASVRADGGGIRSYGNGAFVIYGKHAYTCEAGRWEKKGPASVWLPSAQKSLAENQERGCQE